MDINSISELSKISELFSLMDRPDLFFKSAILSIPLYIGLGSMFFDNWDDFLDSLRLFFQPQWLSALRGEWNEDNWVTLKLLIYFIFCIAAATTVYKFAKNIF